MVSEDRDYATACVLDMVLYVCGDVCMVLYICGDVCVCVLYVCGDVCVVLSVHNAT